MYVTHFKPINNYVTPQDYTLNFFCNTQNTQLTTNYKKVTFKTEPERMQTIFNRNKQHYETILDTINTILQPYKNINLNTLYTTFQIPKASGGYRTIHAPKDNFKFALKEITRLLKQLNILEHEAAYAYVEQRSPHTALLQHKFNNSTHFLKVDFKDFFGSCKTEFVKNQLKKLFPITLLINEQKYDTIINDLINVASLDGALPQGSPLSPYLTNLVMVEFDYLLTNNLPKNFKYTRYADDLQISCDTSFDPNWVIKKIERTVKDTPLKIKPEKTHYGSNAGRNWNLGLMYNKDKNITIGYRQKQIFKSMLFNLIHNQVHQTKAQIRGIISYYIAIEPDYINYIIAKYNHKYNTNIYELLKN